MNLINISTSWCAIYCHVFCILVISVASPKTLVVQCILFKTLAVVLQYLRDAFNHVCILAEKKKGR